jgi:hypothetical protein
MVSNKNGLVVAELYVYVHEAMLQQKNKFIYKFLDDSACNVREGEK